MKRILQITAKDGLRGYQIKQIYLCDDKLLLTYYEGEEDTIRVETCTEDDARDVRSTEEEARLEKMKSEQPKFYVLLQENYERNKPNALEHHIPDFAYGVITQQAKKQIQHQENADKAARKLARKASELVFPQLPAWP